MSTTLQLVDPDSLAVLFDLNDPTGATNDGGVRTSFGIGGAFALLAPETEFVRFQPQGFPGGTTAFVRDPLVQSSWRTRMFADSYDDLAQGVGTLQKLLKLGGVLKWIPNGSATTRYIDFEPSGAPALFQGQALELYQVQTLFDTPQGVTIVITRQPYVRDSTRTPSLNLLVNPTLLADQSAPSGTPDSWAWDSTTGITGQAIDPNDESYEFVAATTANRSLQQTVTFAATASTFAFDARVDSGTGAKVEACIKYQAGGVLVGSEQVSAPVTLSPQWKRITVTHSDATAHDTAKLSIRLANADAGSYTIRLRLAQFESGTGASAFRCPAQAVSNDPATGGRSMLVWNDGTAPAPAVLQISADSGNLQEALVGVRSSSGVIGRRNLTDYLNGTKYAQCEATGNGWTATLGTDTALSTSDAGYSGSGEARVTYATVATMTRRVKLLRTTLLGSLVGTFDVYCRLKATAASQHTLRLGWAAANVSPASYYAEDVVLDRSQATAFQWEDVKLGTVVFGSITPTGLPTISASAVLLEVWSSRDSGSGNLDMDFLTLVPADESLSRLVVSGQSADLTLGKDLITPPYKLTADPTWGAGAAAQNHMTLNANHEACGLDAASPGAGTILPAGRWRYTATFYQGTGTSLTFKLRVVTVGGGGAGAEIIAKSQTVTNTPPASLEVEFDADGSSAYQAQVCVTAYTSGKLEVTTLASAFVPYLASGEQFATDPTQSPPVAQKWTSGGALVTDVTCIGAVPLALQPGMNVVTFAFGDIPGLGQPNFDSELTRAPVVTVTTQPRWYH